MADITMCTNEPCPLARDCYRMMAESSWHWQSVARFQYEITEDEVICDDYIPVTNRNNPQPENKDK